MGAFRDMEDTSSRAPDGARGTAQRVFWGGLKGFGEEREARD